MSGRGATRRRRTRPDDPPDMDVGALQYHSARCREKKRYTSAKRAKKAAKRVSRQEGRHFRAYFCGLCCGWHLTTSPWAKNS